MNIFGSKKEALIMAGVAAFFVLAALTFTFEPLVAVILKTRTMPAGTTVYLTAASTSKHPDFFDGVMKTMPPSRDRAMNIELLNKIQSLIFGFNITSVAVQSQSVIIKAANHPEQIVADIRRFLSKLTPFEIKTILPDQTSMIETVIDPGLIKIETDRANETTTWTFAQTNPQLTIKKNGSNSEIFLNYPQVVDNHGFEAPIRCIIAANGIKTVSYGAIEQTLVSAFIKGFLAYFRDYTCFQSFSTFAN